MNKKSKGAIPVGALKMTPSQVAGMQGLRSSGASGSHDNRPHRLRTRNASKARAVRDSFEG